MVLPLNPDSAQQASQAAHDPLPKPKGARDKGPEPVGALYLVATPIGNLRDITLRALDILGAASLVLAEDTRVARKLLSAFGLSARLMRCDDHEGAAALSAALAEIDAGRPVVLVSDAGAPLISDPGFPLVRAVLAAGRRVIPIPGASAVLAALSASGLPADRFLFLGFPPARGGARRSWLAQWADIAATLVVFESPQRLPTTLADMAEQWGPRPAVVAREMTKVFEEFRRGTLAELAAAYAEEGPPRGECVIVIDRCSAPATIDEDRLHRALVAALAQGGVKEAATQIAEEFGIPRKEAYARALALKGGA